MRKTKRLQDQLKEALSHRLRHEMIEIEQRGTFTTFYEGLPATGAVSVRMWITSFDFRPDL
jgi:hypothetical protein